RDRSAGTGRHGASDETLPVATFRRPAATRRRGPRARRQTVDPARRRTDRNLDSKNGEAVMELLRELHREGATICMVTHDPRFARHAERQIHLFDGRIVEESVETDSNAEAVKW